MPASAGQVPLLGWQDFRSRFRWKQGEHVALVGNTGSGKSTLALSLLHDRKVSVALATKPKDETMDQLRDAGWTEVTSWPPILHTKEEKARKQIILHPRPRGRKMRIEDINDLQRPAIKKALEDIYVTGKWTIFADEVRYLNDQLGLKKHLELIWLQGRSIGISLMAATQRPFWVPNEMWSQSTHVFLWRESDKKNLDRLVEIGGVDTSLVRYVVPRLAQYNCLYVNTRTGGMAVTWPPAKMSLDQPPK